MQTAFSRFVAPARGHPQLWRLGLGAGLVTLCTLAGTAAIFGAGWLAAGTGEDGTLWADRMVSAETPLGTLLLLFSFSGMAAGAMIAARLIHKRPAASLFGPAVRVVRDFVRAAAVVGALMGVSLAVWSISYDAVPGLSPVTWAALLPATLLGLAIQTGAEELVFRGYLQQQLAARFRSPLAWALVPSLLFGAIHYNPSLPTEGALILIGAATLFGLAAADLTARTGSIGAAWGFHFANNLLAIAILSTEGTITGLGLFRTPYAVDESAALDLLILVDLAFLGLAWWLVRRAVSR
ncbi:lysostaphin resistance A-like protein [Palleronia sp. KMU-117]|uniref:CPBP family intramembrane glutamic endopeptidase n=1 Tax=Palleronia sp. KMU-117 TaxID=3434108 RepID=UPI003D72787E